jgi:hypothetical protein
MKSNDTILLEKAYENILNRRYINENHDSKFKLDMDESMSEALGEDIYSLPRQNFTNAIDKGDLKEMSWYLRSSGDGHNPSFIKIVDFEDDIITIEDKTRSYLYKYIAPSEEKTQRQASNRGIKYQIYIDQQDSEMSKGWNPITPDEIIIGPVEDDEMIYNIIQYMDNLAERDGSIDI